MTFSDWRDSLSEHDLAELRQLPKWRLADEAFNAGRESNRDELLDILQCLDGLAELWGDEGVFRRCRDRLRAVIGSIKTGETM